MPETTLVPDAQYRDSAIQDMLGRPPGWLLRSGLTVIALTVVVVLGLAAVIRYPERVEAPFVLQTETVPLAVHAGTTNYVDAILAGEHTAVLPGDTLLVFRSDGDWRTAGRLHAYLDTADRRVEQLDLVPQLKYPSRVAPAVGQLNATLRAYRSYRTTNGVVEQGAALRREIDQAEALSNSLSRQVDLYEEELGYKDLNVERARSMVRDSLISVQEAESIEEQTIAAHRQREVLIAGDAQNKLRINQLDQQILQLRLDHQERVAEFERQLRQQLQLLGAAVDEFSLTHFIIAHEAGTIDWMPDVREDALVGGAGPLGYVLPAKASSKKVARLTLPPQGTGRIEINDRVILELDAYPARQYGQVNGTLVSVDAVASPDENNQFGRMATVTLPDTLLTSYRQELTFQYNLTGTARIITRERTLLQRLFDQVFNLTLNR